MVLLHCLLPLLLCRISCHLGGSAMLFLRVIVYRLKIVGAECMQMMQPTFIKTCDTAVTRHI